jgi:hypothetical protein
MDNIKITQTEDTRQNDRFTKKIKEKRKQLICIICNQQFGLDVIKHTCSYRTNEDVHLNN